MKRILILIFLLVAPAFIFAQNNDWRIVATDSDSTNFYYKPNTYNTAWVKVIENKSKEEKHNITLYQFDCDNRKIGVVQVMEYKNGKVVNSISLKSYEIEMNYVVPETVGESLLQYFCNK